MPLYRDQVDRKDSFTRFTSGNFSTIPKEIVEVMARRRVGANGWPVMLALCRRIYSNGLLGKCGRDSIRAFTGLTYAQIARAMTELREKEIIAPVYRKLDGYTVLDRSNQGHIAQYCICRDVWAAVEQQPQGEDLAGS